LINDGASVKLDRSETRQMAKTVAEYRIDPAHHSAEAKCPLKSVRATHPNRPAGLADGLELESTPTCWPSDRPASLRPGVRNANALVPPLPSLWRGIRLHASKSNGEHLKKVSKLA
jgi:hypothetical protein